MAVLVETKKEKIHELQQEIRILESELVEKKRKIFIELLTYVNKYGKENVSVLSQLFNVSLFLADVGDLRAQYCMVDFYSGRYSSYVVIPNLSKALSYINNILVKEDIYIFAVEICEKFNDKKKAFLYAFYGIISSNTDNETKKELCKYIINSCIRKTVDFTLPNIALYKVEKFMHYFSSSEDILELEKKDVNDFCNKLYKKAN